MSLNCFAWLLGSVVVAQTRKDDFSEVAGGNQRPGIAQFPKETPGSVLDFFFDGFVLRQLARRLPVYKKCSTTSRVSLETLISGVQ